MHIKARRLVLSQRRAHKEGMIRNSLRGFWGVPPARCVNVKEKTA